MQVELAFRAAGSLDIALDMLAEQAIALGFDAVDYAYMPRARRIDGRWHAPDILSRNFPPRWTRGWSRYAADDPYLWTCYQRNLPLDWNEVKGARWLSETQQRAIAFIDELGFLDGITVPIHLPGGSFAFVSGVSHPGRGAWREREPIVRERLFILAHTFHAAVAHRLGGAPPERPTALSPREREILQHAAGGRSALATARSVHRSVETVRRQRKSAMSKLGARTITQAVGRAMALGLLDASTR